MMSTKVNYPGYCMSVSWFLERYYVLVFIIAIVIAEGYNFLDSKEEKT